MFPQNPNPRRCSLLASLSHPTSPLLKSVAREGGEGGGNRRQRRFCVLHPFLRSTSSDLGSSSLAETTLSAHLDVVFSYLASLVLKQVAPLLGYENVVSKLRHLLLRIRAVLADVEPCLHAGDVVVGAWLRCLNDIATDADNLFDEMSTRFQQLPVANLPAFDFPRIVEGVTEKLDEITKGKAELCLNEVADGCSRPNDGNG